MAFSLRQTQSTQKVSRPDR